MLHVRRLLTNERRFALRIMETVLTAGAERELRRLRTLAVRVRDASPRLRDLPDEDLLACSRDLARRVADGERIASGSDVTRDALALAREAVRRAQGIEAYDEQVMAALALADGRVAELPTGSGKTVVAEMGAYLHSLVGLGVHVVTANGYLAARDADLCARTLRPLGVTVGLVAEGMSPVARRRAYAADVTYSTASEIGFDYLRDNMAHDLASRVQRGHAAAIVDEADSILIDEARTPLIISGSNEGAAQLARVMSFAVATLPDAVEAPRGEMTPSERAALEASVPVVRDSRARLVWATDAGLRVVERFLGCDVTGSPELMAALDSALVARYLYRRDRDYVVIDGEVRIVDALTGRTMEGRRWRDGLHQAIEAREGVEVVPESGTQATVTIQRLFALYDRLSGMTGTARTADAELRSTYGCAVTVIPPHHPVRREDLPDAGFATRDAMLRAVVDDVVARHGAGQPVLVGCTSVAASERLARLLASRGVTSQVLNAKEHEREAAIVARAGMPGAVTVATDMAGRGTDIRLGGDESLVAAGLVRGEGLGWLARPCELLGADEAAEVASAWCARARAQVVAAGGLAVIGVCRHEARRIDDQLRGRSGRQGDVGCSRVYVSLEDDLVRRLGPSADALARLAAKADRDGSLPAAVGVMERAQAAAESRDRASRERVLDYDRVLDAQRIATYGERDRLLAEGAYDVASLRDLCHRVAARAGESEGADAALWLACVAGAGRVPAGEVTFDDAGRICADVVTDLCREVGDVAVGQVAAQVHLRAMDVAWPEHLAVLEELEEGIGWRALAQQDPITEYRVEARCAYGRMVASVEETVVRALCHASVEDAPVATTAVVIDDEGGVAQS